MNLRRSGFKQVVSFASILFFQCVSLATQMVDFLDVSKTHAQHLNAYTSNSSDRVQVDFAAQGVQSQRSSRE